MGAHDVCIGSHRVGPREPLLLLAGPCVIESEQHCLFMAERIRAIADRLGLSYVFKASFDKANRTSLTSFRGPGIDEGLRTLAKVKSECGVPVVTDIHTPDQAASVSEVADVLQIPAFLCRQTDMLVAAGRTKRVLSIKKGQFVDPSSMSQAATKAEAAGASGVMLCERGTTFGYNNLVVDMRSLCIMADLGYPVVFDATHSVQLPSASGMVSGGDRRFVAPLARAAAAVGISGLFLEVHDDPDSALCDGPNMVPLRDLEALLTTVLRVRDAGGL